jgi:transposase-like protein
MIRPAKGFFVANKRYSIPLRNNSEEQKEQILATYQERPSMRGIQRIYGVSRNTLAAWLKKS